jgi:hypothetical protein
MTRLAGRLRKASREIEHIELNDEGDWADLRILNFGDRQAITGAMVEATRDDPNASRLEAGNIVMLQRAIVAWGGPGFGCTCNAGCRCSRNTGPHANDCKAWAITEETVLGLDETGDVLLRVVDAREDKFRASGDPFLLPQDTSPSSSDVEAKVKKARASLPSSTSGISSSDGTPTPEGTPHGESSSTSPTT